MTTPSTVEPSAEALAALEPMIAQIAARRGSKGPGDHLAQFYISDMEETVVRAGAILRAALSAPREGDGGHTIPIAEVEVYITSALGDAKRSEYHRGWDGCSQMLLAWLGHRKRLSRSPDGWRATNEESTMTEVAGTTACPICGKATPHHHEPWEHNPAAWLCEIAQIVTQKAGQEDVWSDWQPSLTFHVPYGPNGSIRNLYPLHRGEALPGPPVSKESTT